MAAPITITGNLQLNPTSVTASAKQVSQALGRITGQASEFQKSLDASTARVFAFGATTAVLAGVGMAFKKMVASTIEVEKRLVEINSIFQATEETFNRFRNSIFQVAKDTGQSFSVVADGAAELARQGLSAEETATRLKDALVLTRISGLGAEQSVKALTAAINGFTSAGLSSAQIVNKLVAVDTNFAVSAQDLADGFSRAGSTAEDAGVSFDELLGLITSVQQKTSRGGAVIGNAFKSIFTRLSRGTTIESLKELGVEIDASQSGVQKLEALASALERTSDPSTASKMKELAGGVFQINVVSAALKDLSSETSLFTQATKISSQASDEASQKNAELNKTMAANINALVVGLTSIGEKIGSLTFGPVLTSLVEVAEKFSVMLDKAFDPEKGNKFIQGLFGTIGKFLSGPGLAMFTVAFLKIFTLIAKFAKDGLKSIFEIGSQTQKIKTIEGGIVDLLNKDKTLRAALSSQTATQAQKEQAIIVAIQKENALLTQQAAILRNIATVAASRGVGGYTQGGGFTGKGKKSFASGFRAEEATAMALGAPKSVRAQRGKGTIGGKSFVMNSHETEIPNFGSNGDSAVIPHYAKGFVPNYAKALPKKGVAAKKEEPTGRTIPADYVDNFSFLVPQVGASGKTQPRTVNKVKYEGGSPIFGIDKKQVQNVSNGKENMLADKVSSSLFKETSEWVQKLRPLDRSVSSSEVGAGFNSVKGAKGALQSAIGASFEVGITKALDYNAAIKDGGDFDVRGGDLSLIRKLFGNKNLQIGDFKSSVSDSNERSFYGKIGKEYALTHGKPVEKKRGAPLKSSLTKEQVKARTKAGIARRAGKAGGYVPNFTQENKGLPLSQIRAHFDGGGNPIAVTNTRDEPNGLKDAIGRERKGIGMSAAGGFVPNYVQQGGGASVTAAANSLKTLTFAANSSSKAMQSNSMAATKSAAATGNLLTRQRKAPFKMKGPMRQMMGSMALSAAGSQLGNISKDENRSDEARDMAGTFSKSVEWGAVGLMMGGPVGAAVGAAMGAAVTAWSAIVGDKKADKKLAKALNDSKKDASTFKTARTSISEARQSAFGDGAKDKIHGKLGQAKSLGLDMSGFAKEKSKLIKIMINSASSIEARSKAEDDLSSIYKDLASLNLKQYASDKEFLKTSKDVLRTETANAQIAAQKQMALANSASNTLNSAAGLNKDASLSSIITGKQTVANATRGQAEFENQKNAIESNTKLNPAEIKAALTDATNNFAAKMRDSAVLLQSTLNNESVRLKEIGAAMDNLGGDIFNESLSKISDLINGPKTNVKTLQDTALEFQKENTKGKNADPEKLAQLAQALKVQVDSANASSAGSGFMLAEAAGVKDIETQLADVAKRLAVSNFDFTGAKDVLGNKERAGVTQEYSQRKNDIIGGEEGRQKMADELAKNRQAYEKNKEAVKAQGFSAMETIKALSELKEAFVQSNRKISKTEELGSLKEEFQGKLGDTSLGSRIGKGARGESEKELDVLSKEKERVAESIKSLNLDIETFAKQFRSEGGKSYMEDVQKIDEAMKAAADNVKDLAGVSEAMDMMNKQTISTIKTATEAVKSAQEKIMIHKGEIEAVKNRIRDVENTANKFGP